MFIFKEFTMSSKSLIFGLIFLFLASFAVLALDGPSQAATRDLVFEDDDEEDTSAADAAKSSGIENPSVISFKTTLDLTTPDGKTDSVPTSHEFKTGDKVKLRYTTNTDGYVYWMAKMSSGQYSILFPSPSAGSDNFVKKNANNVVPVKGAFRFDDTPGTETLLVVFSPEKIPELDEAVAEAAKNSGKVVDSAADLASLESSNESKRTTRDLVFEEEDDEEVSVKTQAATAGEPFVAVYELVHK
jgi:Sec-independent protein translocase protein TatA